MNIEDMKYAMGMMELANVVFSWSKTAYESLGITTKEQADAYEKAIWDALGDTPTTSSETKSL